ncbi:MAG: SDR family oxidoreductase [Candidatus Binatia bacterium]|jgi:NAD(P)-dependent dehydrogenase (short-subunit alcohol dehydrogenase family)
MTAEFSRTEWAVILGGSSGFGLATAHKLSAHGMSLCVVHRDRRGAMERIDAEFARIRSRGTSLLVFNADALDRQTRATVLDGLCEAMGPAGRVRVLLHSIAFGNLKLIAPNASSARDDLSSLAAELAIEPDRLAQTIDRLFAGGLDALHTLASPPAYPSASFIDEEDLTLTIHSMGTSLLGWTQEILRRGLFAEDARVFGLTSEGNELAWKGYAAVAAAKVALESVARSIAVEMAHRGLRCNVIQAGVTDTPALRLIPGAEQLKSHARLRNPFRRLTTPQDVANAIFLLSTDEAAWINGEVVRVDGGEHVSGLSR